MIAEVINQTIYEGPEVAQQLDTLKGINSGFKRTILEWIESGHTVSITKDKYNTCLKYDFKISSTKPPRLGQLVIQDVF